MGSVGVLNTLDNEADIFFLSFFDSRWVQCKFVSIDMGKSHQLFPFQLFRFSKQLEQKMRKDQKDLLG